MKKIILFLVLTTSVSSFAQSTSKEEVAIIQEIYGKSKRDLVKDYIVLSEAQSASFWKIYDEYEAERKTLGQEKIVFLNDYAANYATLTDESADKIAKGVLKNNTDYDKLYSKFYEKFKKAIGAINASKFIQLEIYLQTEIRSEIQNSIPFIGEMEMAKPSKK
jgi:hypothetical protein